MFPEVIGFSGYDFAPQVLVASDFSVTFTAAVSVLTDSSVTYCTCASEFPNFSKFMWHFGPLLSLLFQLF